MIKYNLKIIKKINYVSKSKYLVQISKKGLSTITSDQRIKIEWKNYNWKNIDKKLNFNERYKELTYDEQLKIKKQDFIKAFKNVLITLSYDEKLSEDVHTKQQLKGENILSNSEDIQALSSSRFKDILTNDILSIKEDESSIKSVGKYTRIYNSIAEDKDCLEEDNLEASNESEYIWRSQLSKQHEQDYPYHFKLISNHFEEFIKNNKLPTMSFASYYTHFWHWNKIEIRRTRNNKNMLIVPFNPQELNEEAISEQKKSLKDYFSNGPGKECNLDSLYFHKMNPKNEFIAAKENFELLYGCESLIETCDGKQFNFFADNYYPQVFESYEKLNKSLASMLETVKNENRTDRLIELDGKNGVLGTLVSHSYNKYFSIQNSYNTSMNTKTNLENNGLKENDYFMLSSNLVKGKGHLKYFLKNSSEDSRFCFVFQDFKQPMFEYQKQMKKKLLIYLRSQKQIKSIILVTNISALFKLEQYCYELMTGERKKEGIFGEPFCAISAKLIDQKPRVSNCYIIIRLDRD